MDMKRLQTVRKRFIILAVFAVSFFGIVAVTGGVRADNAILQGLRQGASYAFGDSSTSSPSTNQSTPTPDSTTTSNVQYVALGDSVSAGLGLAGSSGICGRSTEAYSSQVASTLGLGSQNFACSGATAGDLVTKQGVDGPNITAQLDSAYASGQPQLITITAGANDIRWKNFIQKCYVSTCGTSIDTDIATGLIASVKAKLAYALTNIDTRDPAAPPRVILTGYYNPVSAQCVSSQLSASEITWFGSQLNRLNSAISDVAASYSYASFAPVDFTGHDLCSADPWVQGIQAAAPVHPTAAGQAAIAESVIRTYRPQ